NNKVAPDGQYYLQAEGVIDFSDAKWQSIELPVIVDTTAPELKATFDSKKQIVKVDTKDTGSGLAYWDVLIDGKSILEKPYTAGEKEHKLATKPGPAQKLTVVAIDYAGNKVEKEAQEEKETTPPDLRL